MADKQKLHHDEARGAQAQALLNNELLQEIFQQLEADLIECWKTTAALDEKAREKLWQAVVLLGKIRGSLITVARDGKLAREELAQLAEMANPETPGA